MRVSFLTFTFCFFFSILVAGETLPQEKPKPFSEKLKLAIEKYKLLPIDYEDHMGEGPGTFDPDPRYYATSANCLTWLQLVLSHAYAGNENEEHAIMDQLRYYWGKVAFGLRKHYIDHWLLFDPTPLEPLLTSKVERKRKTVKLDFKKFRKSYHYGCSLYKEDFHTVSIEYYTNEKLKELVTALPPGDYVLFGVASKKYNKKYGKNSGPLGFTHPTILEKPSAENSTENVMIYNASIVAGRVDILPFDEFIKKKTPLFEGYGIYRVNPNWNWRRLNLTTEAEGDVNAIIRCEKRLKTKIKKRHFE